MFDRKRFGFIRYLLGNTVVRDLFDFFVLDCLTRLFGSFCRSGLGIFIRKHRIDVIDELDELVHLGRHLFGFKLSTIRLYLFCFKLCTQSPDFVVDEELTAGIAPGRRKSFRRNGKGYRRLAEHLGVFPLVMVSGGDTTVTSGEPSERRRFVDQTASQSRAGYLDALMRYNSAVEQRNGLLRAESRAADSLFEAIEFQIEMSASELVRERRVTVEALSELVRDIYGRLSGDVESAGLAYRPSFDTEAASLAQKLGATRARDLILGHTSSGPHRDELDFTIGGIPLRRYASQGQEKSFAIALRLAQYRLLHGSLGIHPLLLLDDVFDRLDAGRVEALIGIVSGDECYGQIFVTDTDRHHLGEIIGRHPSASRMWRVENGSFIES